MPRCVPLEVTMPRTPGAPVCHRSICVHKRKTWLGFVPCARSRVGMNMSKSQEMRSTCRSVLCASQVRRIHPTRALRATANMTASAAPAGASLPMRALCSWQPALSAPFFASKDTTGSNDLSTISDVLANNVAGASPHGAERPLLGSLLVHHDFHLLAFRNIGPIVGKLVVPGGSNEVGQS